jgi:hypothetical protein
MLLDDRIVSVTPTPLGGGLDGPPEPRTASSERHPPGIPESRPLPVQRETQEVEGRATSLAPVAGRPKDEATSLLRVESQAKRLEPRLEDVPHVRGVVVVFETQHKIVRIADDRAVPLEVRSHLTFEPNVEDVMQIHVPEQR